MKIKVHDLPSLPLLLSLVLFPAITAAQQGAPGGEWPDYGGDLGSTKFAPLSQIDKANVENVSVAWMWHSPDDELVAENPRLRPGAFKATPLMVDGVLYIQTSLSLLAAIDATSGEELWLSLIHI